MTPKALIDAFFNTGQILADLIQPYALHLLYLLIFIEVCTIGITWMMGSDDVAEAPWRILRLVFSGMFAWWWIQNAWPLGMDLIGSFDQIGRNISNTPDGLSPAQFFDIGLRIAKLLWNSPSAGGFTHIGLEIVEAIVIVAIVFFLGVLAAVAAFTLVSMMLIIGPGSIFLSFMACRFTASLSENYFIWLVRTGALLLGFYVVLATAQHFAALWNSTLATTCGLAPSTLPVPFLGGPPTAAAAVTCRTPIPLDTLWTLFADVILLVIVGLGVPFMIASLAGHGVHLALENLASARYLAGSAARPVSKAVAGLSHQIQRMNQNSSQRSTLQQRIAAGEAAASQAAANKQTTPPPPANAFGVQPTQTFNGGAKPTSRI
jgi:P-type conjugative transfer protein TrbL